MGEFIHFVLQPLAALGGIAGVIAAAGWARAECIRAEGKRRPASDASQETILAELKHLKQQIKEMQSTSHEFDLSLDAALTRLEQRVNRLEAKAPAPPLLSQPGEPRQTVGQR
ncbi:MAG: hypothetical protein JO250_08725 [Armatimonadetes bacterium]|nr:hypothetical protein [Armatimonadota bacterium]